MIRNKWVMVENFEQIEEKYGKNPLRICQHTTSFNYLAFFIRKGVPWKKGTAITKYLCAHLDLVQARWWLKPCIFLLCLSSLWCKSLHTEFNFFVERLYDSGILNYIFFRRPFVGDWYHISNNIMQFLTFTEIKVPSKTWKWRGYPWCVLLGAPIWCMGYTTRGPNYSCSNFHTGISNRKEGRSLGEISGSKYCH